MADLKIDISLDRSQAKAEANRFADDMGQMNARLLQQANARETAEQAGSRRTAQARKAVAVEVEAAVKGSAQGQVAATDKAAAAATGGFATIRKAGVEGLAAVDKSSAALWSGLGGGLMIAQQGFSTLSSLTAGFRKALDDAFEAQKKLGSGFNAERDRLSELADLHGKVADNAFVVAQAEFAVMAGGLTQAESTSLQTEYMNVAAQHIGKRITAEQSDALQISLGGLARAKGVAPGIVGELGARVAGFKDYSGLGKAGAGAAAGDVNQVLSILASGSGTTSQLIQETNKLTATSANEDALRGSLRSVKDAAKLISVMTEGFPEGQAEAAGAALRGVRGLGRAPGQAPFLKEAGVAPDTDTFEAIARIGQLAETRAAAGPEGTTIQDILKGAFGDELTVRGLGVAYNQGVAGGLFGRRDETAAEAAGPEAAAVKIDEYKRSEAGVSRIRDAQTKLIEARRGAETSKIDILRREAFNRLLQSGMIDTTDANVKKFIAEKGSFGLLGGYQQERVDTTVEAILQERLPEGQRGRVGLPWSAEARAQLFNQQIGAIEETGRSAITDRPALAAAEGVPGGGGGQGEVVGELKKLNRNLTPMQRPAPPVRMPPPVPARRNAP